MNKEIHEIVIGYKMFRDLFDLKNSKYSLGTLSTLQSNGKEKHTLFTATLKMENSLSSETSVQKECNTTIPAAKQYQCSRVPIQNSTSTCNIHTEGQ
jgi:hypothetical protein